MCFRRLKASHFVEFFRTDGAEDRSVIESAYAPCKKQKGNQKRNSKTADLDALHRRAIAAVQEYHVHQSGGSERRCSG